MKYISLLRHAQAQNDFKKEDKLRPLSHDGQAQAIELRDILSLHMNTPDKILCSPATRTKQTLDIILKKWKESPPETEYLDSIYLAPMGMLIELIQKAPEDSTHILIVGHNPAMQMFSNWLFQRNSDERNHDNPLLYGYAPATYSRFCFENLERWQDLQPHSGVLDLFVSAK